MTNFNSNAITKAVQSAESTTLRALHELFVSDNSLRNEFVAAHDEIGKHSFESFIEKHSAIYLNIDSVTEWTIVRDKKISLLEKEMVLELHELGKVLNEKDATDELIPEQILLAATGVSSEEASASFKEKLKYALGALIEKKSELTLLMNIRASQELSTELVPYEKIEEMLKVWSRPATRQIPTSSSEDEVVRAQIDKFVNDQLKYVDDSIERLKNKFEQEKESTALLPDCVLKMCTGKSSAEDLTDKQSNIRSMIDKLTADRERLVATIKQRVEVAVDLYLAKMLLNQSEADNQSEISVPINEIVTKDYIINSLMKNYESDVDPLLRNIL